jgi:hypothetical protein
MSGDHRIGVERLNDVEGPYPFLPLLTIRLGQVEVDIVAGYVAGNHQSKRRHVENGGVVSVGMADVDGDQLVILGGLSS